LINAFGRVDELLRGRRTGPEVLETSATLLPLRSFLPAAIVLGCVYGFFMGWYAVLGREPPSYMQLVASTVKTPALFLLTLFVTFPSLYVFNALMGGRLGFAAALRLLVGAIVVNLAVAASLGPVLGFFTLSTTSYPFMVLLNVALLGTAGLISAGFLLRALRALSGPPEPAPILPPNLAPEAPDAESAEASRLPRFLAARAAAEYEQRSPSAAGIFPVWAVLYGLVGAQMAWVLRPFIGNPKIPFAWLRPIDGNFFSSVVEQILRLTGAH
jgi:hypothetical protein